MDGGWLSLDHGPTQNVDGGWLCWTTEPLECGPGGWLSLDHGALRMWTGARETGPCRCWGCNARGQKPGEWGATRVQIPGVRAPPGQITETGAPQVRHQGEGHTRVRHQGEGTSGSDNRERPQGQIPGRGGTWGQITETEGDTSRSDTRRGRHLGQITREGGTSGQTHQGEGTSGQKPRRGGERHLRVRHEEWGAPRGQTPRKGHLGV